MIKLLLNFQLCWVFIAAWGLFLAVLSIVLVAELCSTPFNPTNCSSCSKWRFIFTLLGFQIFPQHSDIQDIGIICSFAFFHLFPKNFGSIDVAFIVACSLKRPAFFVHHPSHGRIFQYGGQIRAIVYPFVHLGLK